MGLRTKGVASHRLRDPCRVFTCRYPNSSLCFCVGGRQEYGPEIVDENLFLIGRSAGCPSRPRVLSDALVNDKGRSHWVALLKNRRDEVQAYLRQAPQIRRYGKSGRHLSVKRANVRFDQLPHAKGQRHSGVCRIGVNAECALIIPCGQNSFSI